MGAVRGAEVVKLLVAAALGVALAACTQRALVQEPAPPQARTEAGDEAVADPGSNEAGRSERARKVDPRKDGVEIGLGEWAITSEAPSIRPGKITFVIRNRGTMAHGFEIELEGDSSGHGSGDLFKAESGLLQPGGSTRMTMSLEPGVYKIECLVDGHDDMGMEDILEVRRDAPLKKVEPAGTASSIAIADFAFAPATAHIAAGSQVTWENHDPTSHTVTGEAFGSDTLDQGATFEHVFDKPGTYAYKCAIHPDMQGKVEVE